MKKIAAILYHSGYALTDYYDKYGKGDDLSLFIIAMTKVPPAEYSQKVSLLIDGWLSWIMKELSSIKVKFDIVIRAFGHDELEYVYEKPMSVLALKLAKELGAENRVDLIKKMTRTESQKSLPYDFNVWRRKKNVEGSIISNVSDEYLRGKTILVLDDIKTTGSTLQSIATALYCNGQSKLYFLALGETTQTPKSTNIELLTHLKNAMGLP